MKARSWLLMAATCLAVVGVETATAQQKSITVSSWGGAFQKAQRQAWFDLVEKELGITVKEETTQGIADVRAQVASGKPTWDLTTQGYYTCALLEKEGRLEKLDPAIVNDPGVPASLKSDHCMSQIVYSVAIGWRKNSKGWDNRQPKGWDAFWNVKDFPGGRSMRRHPIYNMEAALIADGVPMDKLYPLDVERAFKKLESMKPHVVVWWNSGAQSVQVLQDGEVEMVGAWNGRIQAAMGEKDGRGGPIGITFDQQMLVSDAWMMPKGAPNKELAMKALAIMMRPDAQASISKYINYAPANLKGYDTGIITKEMAAGLPNSPENVGKGFVMSVDWWVQNNDEMVKRFDAFLQK
ncbi:MAG: ABC transporter substrate-binding protein [Alphaproteobacteria bacterium]|nr:ABC transporter substrate-binding protein [Alphaproteobacteria bacterium]